MLQFKNQILQGDALTRLKYLDSESVDCIITSPPYWALRDYKVDGQIGVEKTIDEYVTNLIKVFSEAKRVLKKSGTCWIVLGDTYSSSTSGNNNGSGKSGLTSAGKGKDVLICDMKRIKKKTGLPDKSLCMIPERFAIKMIDSGWILRNKIIWWKPNCMPSSAKDRFTVDYEYVYFFTKSQKYYFKTQYEPHISVERGNQYSRRHKWNKNLLDKGQSIHTFHKPNALFKYSSLGRIKRCVWSIPTKPFPEAHFAVFPEQLVKQCLDAGCPTDGTVLDMFMGSGTVALVALKNNRKFIGIELNESYVAMILKRIKPCISQMRIDSNFNETNMSTLQRNV